MSSLELYDQFLGRRENRPAPPMGLVMTSDNIDTDLLATWWPQTRSGNWYWRCDVPLKHLPGQALEYRFKDLRYGSGGITMPRQKGLASIWCYPGNATRGITMRALQVAGFKVLVEVDDNYLVGHTRPPGTSEDWKVKLDVSLSDKTSSEAHRKLASFADGVIVTTETLARAYREINDNVHICPNSIEPDDWEEPKKPDDGVFRIGYTASHSHFYDVADVKRALAWAADQPGVEVLIFGLKRSQGFPVTQVPWTNDLPSYRRSLQTLDLGVCPLRPGAWANCKSDIKAMEYTMAGAGTIVSATWPYEPWWHKDFALTAETPKDFLRHVKWCVANQDGVREMAARAKEYVMGNRLITQHIESWREAVS